MTPAGAKKIIANYKKDPTMIAFSTLNGAHKYLEGWNDALNQPTPKPKKHKHCFHKKWLGKIYRLPFCCHCQKN